MPAGRCPVQSFCHVMCNVLEMDSRYRDALRGAANSIRSLESRLAEANERAEKLLQTARALSKELCDFEVTGVSYPARLDFAWLRLTIAIAAIDAAREGK